MNYKDSQKRVVYLNGELILESEARISLFDSGFQTGNAVFDVERTFNGKPFKLHEHILRLFRSLRYARIDPGLKIGDIERLSMEALNANMHLLKRNDDYFVIQSISGGIDWPKGYKKTDSTVAIYCQPLPFSVYAKNYETGVHAVIPSIRHVPPQCLDPKVKTCSRMHMQIATKQSHLVDPDAYSLLLDIEGNITEIVGANFFIVEDGVLVTPPSRNILCGISRETVFELAKEIKIPVKQVNIQPYDAYNADEAFYTNTSRCIMPISKIDNIRIGNGKPGAITRLLLQTWSKKVGVNIVDQALAHLGDTTSEEMR